MAYSFLTHAAAGAASTPTTSAIDTSGADLLVAATSQYAGIANGVLSDSKGNTWTPLTLQSGTIPFEQIFYVVNPTVGTGHTFQVSNGGFVAASLAVAAFSGAHATPLDVQNGTHAGGGSSIQPGSITPNQANSLIICGAGITDGGSAPYTINSSFNITDAVAWSPAAYEGVLLAYLIQGSASAVNPTVSWSGTSEVGVTIAAFKPAAGVTVNSGFFLAAAR